MAKELVGEITHYFNKIGVAVVALKAPLAIGDKITVESSEGKVLEQTVESMQIEHKTIEHAETGMEVGLKVNGKVHAGNKVYKITDE